MFKKLLKPVVCCMLIASALILTALVEVEYYGEVTTSDIRSPSDGRMLI